VSTRRQFLWSSAAAAAAPRLAVASEGAAVKLTFDEDLRNEGEWGGSARPYGPAVSEPLVVARGGAGVADFTSDWFHVQGGRLLYESPKLLGLESFSGALAFQTLRSGAACTLLMRLSQWRVLLSGSGLLQVQVYYSRTASQVFPVAAVWQTGIWCQFAFSVDLAARKLHFVFRRSGAEEASTGAFALLPEALGPATDRSRQILDIGGHVSGEKHFGYLDNVMLWTRALAPEDLRAALDGAPPSLRQVGLPAQTDLIFPLTLDPDTALPRRSDVCLSSRWWRPRDSADPNDTLRDLTAFRATRLEWIYETRADRIRAVKERGLRWISTINGNDATPGRSLSIRDFEGNFAVYPHMITWKQADGLPPGAGCVNNPGFQKQQLTTILTALANGADGIQYDDWGSNVYVFGVIGDCLCEHCVAKFRTFLAAHHRPEELAAWGVADPAGFNYREFLAAQRGVKSQSDYLAFVRKSPADPLRVAYTRFQMFSVRDMLALLQREIKERRTQDGLRPTLAVNNAILSPSQQSIQFAAADLPDYYVFEGSDESVGGIFLYSKISEALGKVSVLSPFPYEPHMTRATIALRYALGQLCLAPYDIWMHTSDLPRYFGTPEQYGDLFDFVRANEDLFDRYDTVAAVAIAVDTSRAPDSRLRPLVETLAHRNVPFLLVPLGSDFFTPAVNQDWCRRLPFVIDLTRQADTRQKFPEARFLHAAPTEDELRMVSVVQVEAPGVLAVVRGRGDQRDRSLLVHLINRNFDDAGRTVPLEHFGVRLLQPEFWGEPKQAELLAPSSNIEMLDVRPLGRDRRLVIPRLASWAVVKIQGA
jgi:hypothetical protein